MDQLFSYLWQFHQMVTPLPLFVLVIMWILQLINALTKSTLAIRLGIRSWSPSALGTIFTAPFLHANWSHLIANSFSFLVLGTLVARTPRQLANPYIVKYLPFVQALNTFELVALASLLTSGIGAFLIGKPGKVTVGASGMIWGFFGFLVTNAYLYPQVVNPTVGLAVIATWGLAMLRGIIPRLGSKISWQGHLFGLIGGILSALYL